MAIEFVSGSNVAVSFDDSGDSVAVDVGSGDDRLLVAVTAADGTTNASAPTYDSAEMSPAVVYTGAEDQDPRTMTMWYLIAPSTGSNTLVTSYSSGTPDAIIAAAAFTGVLQVDPLDDTSEAHDTASPYALELTPSTNDQLLVVAGGDDEDTAGSRTPTGNTVELHDRLGGSGAGDWGFFMGYYVKTGASGAETLGYSEGSASHSHMVGATFKPKTGSFSPSISPSLSPSPSPTPGWVGYSREDKSSLPTDDAELATVYSAGEITNVSTSNNTRVEVTGGTGYAIHQFKTYTVLTGVDVTCEVQSILAPTDSTVYLQVYNYDTPGWEAVDNDSTTAADTDFSLTGTVNPAADYIDDGVITFRVYQAKV